MDNSSKNTEIISICVYIQTPMDTQAFIHTDTHMYIHTLFIIQDE